MNKSKPKRVLVLGGAGQIGKPLCSYLNKQHIKTLNLDLVFGSDHDLRKRCDLLHYWMRDADAVFFLAYDIGGSKFLKTQQGNYNFLQNNIQIMSNVFSALEQHKKPFIFASSAMTEMPWSPYGDLKRIGEHFTKSLGGVTARFWNVYGPERDEEKSHVITDFIKKAKENGVIDMMTDGTEVRQFLYADDCAEAMLNIINNYSEAKKHTKFDITNFVWTDINEIAEIVAEHYKATIIRPDVKDTVQHDSQIEPQKHPIKLFWDPDKAVNIKDGVHKMIDYYEELNEQ